MAIYGYACLSCERAFEQTRAIAAARLGPAGLMSTALAWLPSAFIPLAVIGVFVDGIRSRRGQAPSRPFWAGYAAFLVAWLSIDVAVAAYQAIVGSNTTMVKGLPWTLLIGLLFLAGALRRIRPRSADGRR